MRRIDLGWIRVFVEVVRAGSLSEAARRLNLTQPAVSYQIRRAEAEFGTALLRREHRGVQPTEAGQALFAILSPGVEQVDGLAARLRRRSAPAPLRLHTDYAFSGLWLIPRIHRFRDAHPGTELQIIASQQTDPGRLQAGDIAVLFGNRDRFGPEATLLIEERVVPVCAPHFAEGRTAGTFDSTRLIHLDSPEPAPWFDWRRYLAATGRQADLAKDQGNLRFNTYSLVIDAAVAGQGVALGWGGLVDQLLARGLLRRFGEERVAAGNGYFMIRRDPDEQATRPLRDWLVAESAATPG
ncbi:choline sulfate utilization transcriptional regulator [Paracoccus aminovorans]|uniref:choline sulfate utilization transcriptional regulator n=1 Tax=Paracoccus aminovorans TaxID=34004 RepID=UPI002B262719|nr:LysR family transcriptional regulator [Paracoccus aminovorans]